MQDYNPIQKEIFQKIHKVKANKKSEGGSSEQIDDIVDKLIQNMNDAIYEDRESNKNKQYALKRLQLANKVYPELRKM